MSEQETLEQSYLHLVEFLMLSKRRVIALGAEFDLTSMQALMLFLLDRPRPMLDFKKVFNCDASNVTGLVDGLEQKKLAARFENPTDRRIKMIKLSPKGQRVRNQLMGRLTGHSTSLLSRLSPAEFKTFISLLQKVTQGEMYESV